MASPYCFFKSKPFSLIAAALVLSLTCACFFGFGFSSILLTSLALIVCNFLLFTKQNIVTEEQQAPAENGAVMKLQIVEQELESDEQLIHDYSIKSSKDFFLSQSEESEVDWPCRGIVYQSPDCSDGSISDEERDLIEIALPSGHCVGKYKEQEVPKSHFSKQHGLMELLAAEINYDMNYEEGNLIEIDISMGSIKYSRIEIEA